MEEGYTLCEAWEDAKVKTGDRDGDREVEDVEMSVKDKAEEKEGEEDSVLPLPSHSFAVTVGTFTLPDRRALRENRFKDG